MNQLAAETPSADLRRHLDAALASPVVQGSFLTLFAAVLMFAKLGGLGLANYDDCFYAQKAKEILRTGSWMTMHYNGQPAFENAPFFMWLVALSYKIFGVTEYAAKFPSALMGVATVLLLYLFARRMFTAWTAFFSSFILSTTITFTRYARHAMIDVTLTFFFCLAMFAFFLSFEKNRRYFLLWGLGIGICVLAKSVLGFFPLVIAVLYIILSRQWKFFFDPWFLAGVLVALVVGGSWYLHEILRFGPEFIRIHFGWLIIYRGLQLEPQPWTAHLSYLQDLATTYWPWLPFLLIGTVVAVRRALRGERSFLLLLVWVATVLVTMSVMMSRVVWYIMPIFPATAILSAVALGSLLKERRTLVAAKICVAVGAVAMAVLVFSPVRLEAERESDVRSLAPYVRFAADSGAGIVAYRQDYYGLNNSLLFYSDHAAFPIFREPDELLAAMRKPGTVLCVLDKAWMPELGIPREGLYLLRMTENLALVANRRIDVSGVSCR